MILADQIDLLNHFSLNEFKHRFSTLSPPPTSALSGLYKAVFIGPLWLRKSAPTAIALGGMPGWWGKEFFLDGSGINLLTTREKGNSAIGADGCYQRVLPFHLIQEPSLIDRKPGISVRYDPGCPFPWMHVLDELRWMDRVEGTLLGMTVVNTPSLRSMAFPFLLTLSEMG